MVGDARVAGEDGPGEVGQHVLAVVDVEPAREAVRELRARFERGQGAELVEEGRLGADGHEQFRAGDCLAAGGGEGEEVHERDPAEAVADEYGRPGGGGDPGVQEFPQVVAAGLVAQDVAERGGGADGQGAAPGVEQGLGGDPHREAAEDGGRAGAGDAGVAAEAGGEQFDEAVPFGAGAVGVGSGGGERAGGHGPGEGGGQLPCLRFAGGPVRGAGRLGGVRCGCQGGGEACGEPGAVQEGAEFVPGVGRRGR